MLRLIGLLSIMLIAGCATITRGTTQAIAIHTPGAPGASCVLSSGSMASQTVVTPAMITVEKSMDNIKVQCSKECFHEGTGLVVSSMEAMTAGNLLVGGVIGLGVDAVSGAMNKYNPETGIVMAPIPGCRASA